MEDGAIKTWPYCRECIEGRFEKIANGDESDGLPKFEEYVLSDSIELMAAIDPGLRARFERGLVSLYTWGSASDQ